MKGDAAGSNDALQHEGPGYESCPGVLIFDIYLYT